MLRFTRQVNAEPRSTDSKDLNLLVYKFDARKPWQQFKEGHPVASSVERGRRNLNSNKLKIVYLPKKKKAWIRRKNGVFKDLNKLQFTCCDSGCLLKEGLYNFRGIAMQDSKEACYIRNRIMNRATLCQSSRRTENFVPYTIARKSLQDCVPEVYSISKSKIEVFLKKIDQDGLLIRTRQKGAKGSSQTSPRSKRCCHRLHSFL